MGAGRLQEGLYLAVMLLCRILSPLIAPFPPPFYVWICTSDFTDGFTAQAILMGLRRPIAGVPMQVSCICICKSVERIGLGCHF